VEQRGFRSYNGLAGTVMGIFIALKTKGGGGRSSRAEISPLNKGLIKRLIKGLFKLPIRGLKFGVQSLQVFSQLFIVHKT